MIIYLITFLITCILCAILQRYIKNKILKVIFSIIIILIPSVLGGVRDLTIGTDVLVYGEKYFNHAINYNNLIDYITSFDMDIGYLIINFLVSRFTSNVHIFLFVLQLIINTLVFIVMYKYKEKIPLWMSMLCYLTLYYCRTFNFLRQSLALAIVFCGIPYIEKRKFVKYFFVVLCASLFHPSAWIAIVLYFINILLNSKNEKMYSFLIITIGLFVVLAFSTVIEILNNMKILPERYYAYLSRYAREEAGFNLIETAFRLIWIALYLLFYKKITKQNDLYKMFGMACILDVILFQLKNTIKYTDRLAFYFGYIQILMYPIIIKNINNSKSQQLLINFISILMLIGFWYYKFAILKSCEVYPYTSSILGI